MTKKTLSVVRDETTQAESPETLEIAHSDPPSFGSFTQRLDKPRAVATITAAEAVEIRTRNELVRDLEKAAERAIQIMNVARNEKISFITKVLIGHNLSAMNNYSIDDLTGVVTLVATAVSPEVDPSSSEG